MSYKPVKKLFVAGDKYTDKNGQEKTKWVEVGTLMQREEDKKLTIVLDAGVNLLAYVNSDSKTGREVWVNVFELRQDENKKTTSERDDIPF